MNEETIVIIQKECKDGKHMVVLSPPGTWVGDPKATYGYRCVCGKHAVILNAPPDQIRHNSEEPIPIYGALGTTVPSPLDLEWMRKNASPEIQESHRGGLEPLEPEVAHMVNQFDANQMYRVSPEPAAQECAELAAKGHWVTVSPTTEEPKP